MSSFNRYYQSELSALRQLGQSFSERNPALAPFLGGAGKDPDVERLFEGFAFLTGRLRERLDDDMPELTHSLMNLLWPNYMRPLPAFSILQFDPLKVAGPAQEVPRNTPVESKAIDNVQCRFRTCYSTQVLPLVPSALGYCEKGQESFLSLRLDMTCEGNLGQLDLRCLRLYLAGEPSISRMLYLHLSRHVVGISLLPLGNDQQALLDDNGLPLSLNLPLQSLRPAGFCEDEALIPYALNTFRGYRLLQEYFAFKEKFSFIYLNGLEALNQLSQRLLACTRSLEIRFDLKVQGERSQLRPTLNNIKLYCTPIVNLFEYDAIPIQFDGKQSEYLILPSQHESHQCGVYSVEGVTGWRPGGRGYREYVPFESFDHDVHFDQAQEPAHYSVRQRSSALHEGLDTYLSLSSARTALSETLSIELTCTNQNLPRRLALGDICCPGAGAPSALTFRNITSATSFFAPPQGKDWLWKLISNMSLNYLSLANINALKVILQTYDFPGCHDPHAQKVSRELLASLKSIRHQSTDRLFEGFPLRGLLTELTIESQGGSGEGEVFLFCSVLNEFFALYSGLNSFHELRVIGAQGENYKWNPRMGQQSLA